MPPTPTIIATLALDAVNVYSNLIQFPLSLIFLVAPLTHEPFTISNLPTCTLAIGIVVSAYINPENV